MEGDPGVAADRPFLSTERLYLRALREEDAGGPYLGWFNDADVCRGNSHHVFPFTRRAALEYIHQVNGATDAIVLAIVVREDGRHIGNIALQRIHPVDRSAEFAIVIGDRAAWGSGYATEAAESLCDHGFRTLNLHRIACGTFAGNTAMRKLAERLGMREEGVRREAAFKDGRYVDVVEYGVLREEFEQRKPRRER